MQYDIRLAGAAQDDGSISFERLHLLTGAFLDIAKGALQLRLLGSSALKGRTAQHISDALAMRITGLSQGSTVLEVDAPPFTETLPEETQPGFWDDEDAALRNFTPLSLLMQTFRDALSNDEEALERLDKPLLQKLKLVGKVFVSADETMTISNRGSVPELELHKADLDRIATLEESIPEPQQIILHGRVEDLKWRGARIAIATEGGRITGILADGVDRDRLAHFWGKPITVAGTANYRADGRVATIEIERFSAPQEGDDYFARAQRKDTAEQQLARQLREGKNSAEALRSLIGIWADEEFDIEADLKLLD